MTPTLAPQIKELIVKIRSGVLEAREELAIILIPIVRKVVSRFYKNYDDRTSTTNFIIAKIFSKLNYIDLDKSVVSYIKLLANNFCVDEYRKTRRKKRFLGCAELNSNLDFIIAPESCPEISKTDYLDCYNILTDNCPKTTAILYALNIDQKTDQDIRSEYQLSKKELKSIKNRYTNRKIKKLLMKKIRSLT